MVLRLHAAGVMADQRVLCGCSVGVLWAFCGRSVGVLWAFCGHSVCSFTWLSEPPSRLWLGHFGLGAGLLGLWETREEEE